MTAGIIALCGYFGKVLLFQSFYNDFPHGDLLHAARSAREYHRKAGPRPDGDDLDTPSGQYKTTIVDRVEGMESTLCAPDPGNDRKCAGAFGDCRISVRYGLAHGTPVPCYVGGGPCCHVRRYEELSRQMGGAVKAGKQMANAIVEYIGGIEVVKAFSQSAGSYKKVF